MSGNEQPPDWLPASSAPTREGNWWVVEPASNKLDLGDLPESARLEIRLRPNSQLTVDACSVRSRARCRIVVDKGAACHLRAGFKAIALTKNNRVNRFFVLTVSTSTRVKASSGWWQIDASDSSVEVAITGASEAESHITGSALINSLEWDGPVRLLSNSTEGARLVSTKRLDARTALRGATVSAESLQANAIFQSRVKVSGSASVGQLEELSVLKAYGDASISTSAKDSKIVSFGDVLIGSDSPANNLRAENLRLWVSGSVVAANLAGTVRLRAGATVRCKSAGFSSDGLEIRIGKMVVEQDIELGDRTMRCQEFEAQNVYGSDASLFAERVTVSGSIEGLGHLESASVATKDLETTVVVCERELIVEGDHFYADKVTLTGSGSFPSLAKATVTRWHPSGDSKLTITEGVFSVRVDARGTESAKLILSDGASIGDLSLDGRVMLECEEKSTVEIDSLQFCNGDSQVVFDCDSSVERLMAPRSGEILAKAGRSILLKVVDPTKALHLTGPESSTFVVEVNDGTAPSFSVEGAAIRFVSGRAEILKLGLQGEPPTLSIERNAIVDLAQGDAYLGSIDGRLSCQPAEFRMGLTRMEKPIDLRVLGLRDDTAGTGQIFGPDPTRVDRASLEKLRSLRVFEPSPISLREFAEGSRDAFEIRERTQWMSDLDSVMARRTQSGRARASIKWSVARLQHRSLAGISGERFGRAVHRMLGYSYKPLWPVAMWILLALLVPLFSPDRIACMNFLAPKSCGVQLGDYLKDVARALFFPLRVLRVTSGETAFAYLPDWAAPIAGAAIGVPFLFVILALKNYLYSPTDKA